MVSMLVQPSLFTHPAVTEQRWTKWTGFELGVLSSIQKMSTEQLGVCLTAQIDLFSSWKLGTSQPTNTSQTYTTLNVHLQKQKKFWHFMFLFYLKHQSFNRVLERQVKSQIWGRLQKRDQCWTAKTEQLGEKGLSMHGNVNWWSLDPVWWWDKSHRDHHCSPPPIWASWLTVCYENRTALSDSEEHSVIGWNQWWINWIQVKISGRKRHCLWLPPSHLISGISDWVWQFQHRDSKRTTLNVGPDRAMTQSRKVWIIPKDTRDYNCCKRLLVLSQGSEYLCTCELSVFSVCLFFFWNLKTFLKFCFSFSYRFGAVLM